MHGLVWRHVQRILVYSTAVPLTTTYGGTTSCGRSLERIPQSLDRPYRAGWRAFIRRTGSEFSKMRALPPALAPRPAFSTASLDRTAQFATYHRLGHLPNTSRGIRAELPAWGWTDGDELRPKSANARYNGNFGQVLTAPAWQKLPRACCITWAMC